MSLEGDVACSLLEENGPSYLSTSMLWDQMLSPGIVLQARVWVLNSLAVILLSQMVEV